MSKSSAKKKRDKLLQAQGKDVTKSRNSVCFSTHVRKTNTKRESMNQTFRKYRSRYDDFDTSFFFVKMTIVAKIHRVPSQSIHPKETPRNSTAVRAADKGSAQASTLVSEADKYFKLCK